MKFRLKSKSSIHQETIVLVAIPTLAMPADAGMGEPPKMYSWDEATTSWVEVEQGA